jgi:hypothetical protein
VLHPRAQSRAHPILGGKRLIGHTELRPHATAQRFELAQRP